MSTQVAIIGLGLRDGRYYRVRRGTSGSRRALSALKIGSALLDGRSSGVRTAIQHGILGPPAS